jgi:hypothetical protein
MDKMVKHIILFLFLLTSLACFNNKKPQKIYTRVWEENIDFNKDIQRIEPTNNIYYDYINRKTYFNDSIFNKLYNLPNGAIIKIDTTLFLKFSNDEFFKHPKYRSLKVGVMSDSTDKHQPRTYYLMDKYGIIVCFGRRRDYIELKYFIDGKDTTDISSFFPKS